jgi:hypothetical protein
MPDNVFIFFIGLLSQAKLKLFAVAAKAEHFVLLTG